MSILKLASKIKEHTLTDTDLNDVAIIIAHHFEDEGLIPNCDDTEDETFFDFQDAIKEKLNILFNVKVED